MSKRGDFVIVSAPGDYGKPRPALVIQSDWISAESTLVALVTSEIVDAPIYRLTIEPSESNGLKVRSQVMVDKIVALPRSKCSRIIGQIDAAGLIALNAMIAVVVGIADPRPSRRERGGIVDKAGRRFRNAPLGKRSDDQ